MKGSLGRSPSPALGRDSQILQGEGFPHEPGGPAPQATLGSGVRPCVPFERAQACSGPNVWAGGIGAQQPGPPWAGGWGSQWPSG